ncbi:hypothetical protein STEG23_016270, partial [Scotinomys teguina]
MSERNIPENEIEWWSLSRLARLSANLNSKEMRRGSCFSLSLSIPILDCHHTWCCCGTPSDFYCATQT